MQDKQELFPKTVEVKFTYRGVSYKEDLKTKEENIYSLITQIEVFVIV